MKKALYTTVFAFLMVVGYLAGAQTQESLSCRWNNTQSDSVNFNQTLLTPNQCSQLIRLYLTLLLQNSSKGADVINTGISRYVGKDNLHLLCKTRVDDQPQTLTDAEVKSVRLIVPFGFIGYSQEELDQILSADGTIASSIKKANATIKCEWISDSSVKNLP